MLSSHVINCMYQFRWEGKCSLEVMSAFCDIRLLCARPRIEVPYGRVPLLDFCRVVHVVWTLQDDWLDRITMNEAPKTGDR